MSRTALSGEAKPGARFPLKAAIQTTFTSACEGATQLNRERYANLQTFEWCVFVLRRETGFFYLATRSRLVDLKTIHIVVKMLPDHRQRGDASSRLLQTIPSAAVLASEDRSGPRG
jgi:hypothetical protein